MLTDAFHWLDVSGLPVWLQLICFFGAGAAGGLVRHVLSEGGLVMPKTVERNGKRLLRLGFLLHMCAGALIGAAIDGNVATAFSFGISGIYVLEKLIQRRMNGKK